MDVAYCQPVAAAGSSNKLPWTPESKIYYGHDPCEHGQFSVV